MNLDSATLSVGDLARPAPAEVGRLASERRIGAATAARRKTPRVSVILVLPDDSVVEPERLALRLPSPRYEGGLVVVACAGHPSNLEDLKRTVRDAQFLHAPPGTCAEDLRQLAMEQTPGDIVTLLSGARLSAPPVGDLVVTG